MCDENVDVPRVARCSPFPLTWGTLWVKKKYLKFLKICLVHVKEESSGNFVFQMSVMLRKINLFGSNAPFLYLLKTSENRKIFRCFQGVEKGCIANKWVNSTQLTCSSSTIKTLKKVWRRSGVFIVNFEQISHLF